MARRIGDPAALVEALESRHAALLHAHLDERLRLSEELLALARRIGERELECIALHWRSFDLLESGAANEAREHSIVLARLAEELRQPTYRYFSLRWDSLWAHTDDRLEDAARLIEEAEAMGVRAQYPDVHVQAMGARLGLAYRQRMLGGFAAMIETSIAENPQLQVNRPALALAHVQAGNREAAAAEFEQLAADGFAALPRDVIWFSTICVLAEVCAGLRGHRPRGDAVRRHPAPPRPDRDGGDGDVLGFGRALPRHAGGRAARLGGGARARRGGAGCQRGGGDHVDGADGARRLCRPARARRARRDGDHSPGELGAAQGHSQ